VDPNYSVYVQYDWDNIDTTTAIPSGTFDITAEEPECTFREAYSAWLESNCE